MSRPEFSEIKSGAEFLQWYWLKAELVEICKKTNLPYNGGKFELRDRIAYALDHKGKLPEQVKKAKPSSKFNWARAKLTLDTVITDNVSFGPNFRRFMKTAVGEKFQCHGDFMDWMKANAGKTLADAVVQWQQLEQRKEDPSFRREIAPYNQYNQYLRDFTDDNPGLSLKEAKVCWEQKKQLPLKNNTVLYEKSDLLFLDR